MLVSSVDSLPSSRASSCHSVGVDAPVPRGPQSDTSLQGDKAWDSVTASGQVTTGSSLPRDLYQKVLEQRRRDDPANPDVPRRVLDKRVEKAPNDSSSDCRSQCHQEA